jgi:hypothetical protein
LEDAAAIEIGEAVSDPFDNEPKFVPRPPSKKQHAPSPIGRRHTKGPKVIQVSLKGNFGLKTSSKQSFIIYFFS